MSKKQDIIEVDPEFGVYSKYKSTKEKKQDAVALMQERLARMKHLPREQVIRAKLLQLKLQMEKYLKDPFFNNQKHFTHFVETYVDAIYSKRNDFANDINVTPVFLSKVINSHIEPTEEFILKLMIHSEKNFKKLGEFHNKIWYQIYFHEKLCKTMSNQNNWRPKIEKQVKHSEMIDI